MSSVEDSEANKSVNIEGILADFFLKKMDGSKSESWSYEKKKKKSKKHKSKKSKHKRSRSHSSDGKSKHYVKSTIDHSSSEEKDIKRLQRLKRLDTKDNLNIASASNVLVPGDLKTKLESSNQSDIPYGPSLETLLGISVNETSEKSKSIAIDTSNCKISTEDISNDNKVDASSDKSTNPMLCMGENKVDISEIKETNIDLNSLSLDKSKEVANIIVSDNKINDTNSAVLKNVLKSMSTQPIKDSVLEVPTFKNKKRKPDKYSRSRSRSRSADSNKRSRSHKIKSDKRSSRSRSNSKGKSRRDNVTPSRKRSRSRSHSGYRKSRRSRSRSEETDRRDKRHSRKHRSRSLSKVRRRSRSRSSSKRRHESKSYRRHRSRSYDGDSRYKSYKKRGSSSEHDSSRRKRSRSKSGDGSRRKRSHSKSGDGSRRKRSHSKSGDGSRRKRSRSKSGDGSRKKRSRSKSGDGSRRKRSRSKSGDVSRRKRSRSKSRDVSRRKRSRSKSREASRRGRSRSKSREASRRRRSRSKSNDKSRGSKSMKIDQAKILEIAQKNVLSMIEKGTLPEGLSLDNFKKEQLLSLKAGGKSVQELTDFCLKLSKKENDPVGEDKDDASSNTDSAFIHHPFKLKEVSSIKLNIRNSVPIPVKTHAEKVAETARLSSQFPVSSGNKHKQKELEWIPVEPPSKDADTSKALVPLTAKTAPTASKKETPVTSVTALPPPETVTPAAVPAVPLPPAEPAVPALPPPPPPPALPPSLPPPLPPSSLLSAVTPVTMSQQPQATMADYPMIPTYAYGYPTTTEINNYYSQVQYSNAVPAVTEQSTVYPVTARDPAKPKKPIDVSAIVAQRFKALTKLKTNPNDIESLRSLEECEAQINDWVQSQEVPGLFTGSTGAKLLSVEELSGPRHWNYRAKKDIFTRAAPVAGGKGMSLLKKMGWNPGEGLGKNKEGSLEPLVLDIKTDKKGLVSEGEGSKKIISSVVKDLQGKHPVSALMELCSKRKWKPPLYTLIQESGPSHKKLFLFKVEVNNVEYQAATPTSNKKIAKADAAVICLQALSVFPKS